uniref:DUF815 domain-containing protein n=1 Tax=Roseibium sp. TaxID=1936156 RepID=UPI003D0EB253
MSTQDNLAALNAKLDSLIELISRAVPAAAKETNWTSADAFVWVPEPGELQAVEKVNRVDITLLCAVSHVRDLLLDNTRRFAGGLPANNALLWGARGMGKSSLVKAAHAAVNEEIALASVKLIEIHREDIESLPKLMALIRSAPYRFIIFCDDLSFDHDDTSYKSLNAVLEGGIEGRPSNVI